MNDFIDDDTVRMLIAAILKQAFIDWRSLRYGKYRTYNKSGGIVRRDELLFFFNSEEFKVMCEYSLQVPVKAVCEKMRIPRVGKDDPQTI